MKFLHLSDLHIGKMVNGFSMLEEQRHVFGQIINYIESEQPTAVLIAGDVYDRTVPRVEAVRLFDDFLTDLATKDVVVILISGNHDSPDRMNYASRLLAERQLHLCGTFDGTLKVVTLSDEFGELDFWLLPFIKPAGIRSLFKDKEIESYSDAVHTALTSTVIDDARRNILLSHQFYTSVGVAPIRSESEINPVGGLDAVDAGLLSQFDYVALGHLHGAQMIAHNIRYAGSPIKYSFSEHRHQKSVTLVEIKEKNDLTITELPLIPLRDMREMKGPLEQLLSDGISSQGNREDYLRVILTDEEDIIDPLGKIRSVYPNVMALDFENAHSNMERLTAPLETEQMLSPYDLFGDFFLGITGVRMSEEQSNIVRALLEGEVDE